MRRFGWRALAAVLVLMAVSGCGSGPSSTRDAGDHGYAREAPFVKRPLNVLSGDQWMGEAIAYGPFRDGQFPGGPVPTKAQLREDLAIMSKHWSLLRVYGATGPTELLLAIIEEDALDMKVMLGAWIGAEDRRDESGTVVEEFAQMIAGNRAEIEAAVRLAVRYPQIVSAVCVGNETMVSWSDHRVSTDRMIALVREVRARIEAPVTVADAHDFWDQPESKRVANELDFIVSHAHPMWGGMRLDEALEWTQRTHAKVQNMHPDHTIVLGETGWATSKHDAGEEFKLIIGTAGEDQQALFYDAATAWVRRERITTFFFEAFDENWKGGDHPDEVEKHWGLYRADRTPKKALSNE